MTVHPMTPTGRIPADRIDALLDRHEPDEWLPDALVVPMQAGMMACAAAFFALIIQMAVPAWLPAAVALWTVWGLALPFAVAHMIRLRRIRRRETLIWRTPAQ